MDRKNGPITNASELGEFAYCRRAWWLSRVQGLRSTNLQALTQGRALHEAHGHRAWRSARLQHIATLAWLFALLLIGAGIGLLSLALIGGGP